MSQQPLPEHIQCAVIAVQEKKAADVVLLDMREAASFTDAFLVCTAYPRPQARAIADEVEKRLGGAGRHVAGTEGYEQGEWVLLDCLDFVVHIFNEKTRAFYDLERLWRAAKRVNLPEEIVAEKT